MSYASSQSSHSPLQSRYAASFIGAFKEICDLSNDNWSLKLLLIDIKHELSLVKIRFKTWEQASETIDKKIEDKLNGTLVHQGGSCGSHAADNLEDGEEPKPPNNNQGC